MASSFVSKCEHLLKCSLCSTNFNNERQPRQLPCYHDMCSICLDSFVKDTTAPNITELTCPKCSERCSTEDAMHSSVNLFIQNISKAISEISSVTSGRTCQACHKIEVTHFCPDCAKSYCENCCSVIHNILTSHKQITSIHDLDNDKLLQCLSTKKEQCPITSHGQKMIDYFCVECQELACVDCTVVKHNAHTNLVIDDAARDKSSLLEDKSNLMKEELNILKQKIDELVKKTDDIVNKFDQTKKNIEKRASDSIEIIIKQKEQMVSELNADMEKVTCKIQVMKKQLQKHVYILERNIEEIKLAMEVNNSTLLLRKTQQLSRQCTFSDSQLTNKEIMDFDINHSRSTEIYNFAHNILGNCILMEEVDRYNLTFDPRGIALYKNICVVASNGATFCQMFTLDGNTIATLQCPDLAIVSDVYIYNQFAYVTDGYSTIHKFDINGKYIAPIKVQDNINPESISIADGKVFVTCYETDQIYVMQLSNLTSASRSPTLQVEELKQKVLPTVTFTGPLFLATSDQLLIVSDKGAHQVHAFKFDGEHVFTYGTEQPGDDEEEENEENTGQLNCPSGVCCHDDHIIISDCGNSRLVVLSDKGKLLGYIECQGIDLPRSVAVGEDGLLRVAHGPKEGPWFVSTIRYKIIG